MPNANQLVRSFLWHSGLGRKVAAKYWQNKEEGTGFNYIHRQKIDVFSGIPVRFEDELYSKFIKADSERWRFQEEYVLEIDDVLLEPERLLGTRPNRELVEQTVVYKGDRQYPYILNHLMRPKQPTELPVAIWYDGSATRNYYHHFVDALSSLQQLERSNLPKSTPLLITRKMYEQSFFQYLYKRSAFLQGLNWYVVENEEWVHVGKLYKLQSAHFSPDTWRAMRTMYELPDTKPWRKVFLSRDKQKYGRYLANEVEAIAVMQKHGFEVVYAEHLTMEEQVQLFQETEYLVALHGAGLIQQFFMNYDHGHIIEIMPSNYLQPLYYWQAYAAGMRYYDVVVGGDMREGKEYWVDVPRLEAAVVRMLQNTHTGRVYGLTQLN
ncbi:glycosyltransferase family 61 protein [Solirubrum puertoriconensis]|uniref:glycosyltransferase family 61 protein n=1 Tax=Solirubrum puertoriconensis TaxID=1751427 RepID=UPI0009902718|nr:glycosyltransferase family 61 protein [Solirubrum puertoriconensis]